MTVASLGARWAWIPPILDGMLDAHRGEALQPIRSELLGAVRMAQHGRGLGSSHRAGQARFGQATFYPRLQSNIRMLRAAYQYVAREAQAGQDISPAAEWLFDNFHLIEAQLREIREGLPSRYYRSLPVLLDAPLAGLPRIYGVAWAYVAHTDSAFDEDLLVQLLDAYQDTRELSQGELWALPTTLRVVLVENLRRLAERIASQRAARELAGLCAQHIHGMALPELQALHALMARRGVGSAFLSALMRALIGQVAMPGDERLQQSQAWLQTQVPDLAALAAQEAADQAADHLSIGNAVTALRRIGAADWQDIVARTSRVVREMLKNPVFAAEDDTTRNTTLHGIERLSVHSGRSESQVALELLGALSATEPATLAAHWLQGDGRATLERALGVRSSRSAWWRPVLRVSRTPAYLGTLALGSAALVATLLPVPVWAAASPAQLALTALTGLLMLLPASEAVVALVNRLISESVPPVHLPRLLLASGIPPEAQVMVVIPALLGHRAGIDALVQRLQLHHLANPEAHAQFALLSDWHDADSQQHPHDAALLDHAANALRALNRQHPAAPGTPARFLLLHRARTFSATQARWQGWERKRGKLQQLVARLATGTPGPFFELAELSQTAPHTRYILTLDSDTQLPPGRLRTLVGVAEHPQNRPVTDAADRRVRQGYGILQPRLTPPLPTAGVQTPWQWLFGGQRGIDPYSAMSSDAYQDLFDEGSFTGKGLLHVATLHAVLGERLPTERVLSHDLLEGALVRCAVVSDVTLIEPDPEHSDTDAARQHRWMRGDWQLLPFLWSHPHWPMGAINRWKLLDNLRRSLVAPASLALIVLALGGQGLALPVALVLTLAAYTTGPLMGTLAAWIPRRWDLAGERFVATATLDLLRALAGGLWQLILLPQHALRALDAVLRTADRLARSRRQLLQWTTAEASQAGLDTGLLATLQRHWAGPWLAALCAITWGFNGHDPGGLGWTLLALWFVAPAAVWAANRAWTVHPARLTASDREWLHGVARDTWRLFERTVDATNHHLPPDNLQSAPYEMLAHRTSPTNIGLYLLSTVCARRFGWIGTQDLLGRLEATLATLHRLERHRGHFLNWYDTRTLQPLPPRYVSTVDSGNLCVHLLAVGQACREWAAEPLGAAACAQAILRSRQRLQPLLPLLAQRLHRPLPQSALGRLFEAEPQAPLASEPCGHFESLLQAAEDELAGLPPTGHPTIVDHPPTPHDELQWLLGDHLATWRSALRDPPIEAAAQTIHTARRLQALATAFETLAWAADFRFLYHPRRHLLHIGYRPDEQQLDTAFYDLLASESRSTSLLAIAKGDVPVRHWTALGRPYFASRRHAVLRSWSGSMFEYLMPTLVMAEPHGSALEEAAHSALREQRACVQDTKLPWGQSESAYAVRDHTLAYQYAPQGVARLALRRTPPAEHVVAPYASVLATLVDPRAACANLHLLARLGARGRHGFFEALDYTPARQTQGSGTLPSHTLVRTSMAHHQGMSIVALANLLHGGVAQRWGMAHPRLQAVASLLHERAPRELAPPLPLPGRPPQSLQPRAPAPVRTLVPGEQALEPTHLLSNGRYTVTLRPGGGGWSRHGQTGITRWRDDALRDAHGSFLYLRRDPAANPVSLTSHPAPDPTARYLAHFHTDRVVFDTTWDDLRVSTTVWVSPEDDIELRQVVLHHGGDEPIELELLSAFDVTLASHAADEAHPAFSGLFVQADWLPAQQALRFVRTPRLSTERALQAVHFVASTQGQVLGLRCQTDRAQWLGRHHPASQPLASLQDVPVRPEPLVTGLDPVAALGIRLRIEPGTQACVTFATAASEDAATLLAVIDKYRQHSYVERSSVMSATLASIPLASGRTRADHLPALQALTTALVMTLPRVAAAENAAANGGANTGTGGESDRRQLWPLGLSGTTPLLLVTAGSPKGMGLLRALVLAQREWARAGIPCDLVVLSHEAHSHHMPLQHELTLMTELPAAAPATSAGVPAGVPAVSVLHHLRLDQVSPAQLATLQRLARVHLVADGRPLPAQVQAWAGQHAVAPPRAWVGPAIEPVPLRQMPSVPQPSVGDFGPQGRTYHFTVGADRRPPRPWINVLANPGFGCFVSDSGAGPTWALNSRLNQLTAWSNDPVADPPGECFLLQDRRSRDIWSVTPSAWGAQDVDHTVTHTQGLTTISHRRGPLAVSVHWCVDPVSALKQVRIRLENQGSGKAHLRITGLVEWLLGEQRSDRATLRTGPCFATPPEEGLTGLLCTQTEAGAGLGGSTAFFCESHGGMGALAAMDWTCDRRAFFDPRGQLVLPQQLGQRCGAGLDPCAALSRPLTLLAGAAIDQVFLIGHAASPEAARALMHQAVHSDPRAREQAAQAQWDRLLGATEVHTPDPLFDALVNCWLPYQTVSSRLWAKAGFYQAGGATGYRDQLQDAMALVWADPALLRGQIVRCAARQFEEGDVQHWWHEPGGAGVRTHFSDDLLWLPYAVTHHLQATGDASLLEELAPFLTGPPVPDGAEDRYDVPAVSELSASVYEHGARAIDHSLRVGVHGLPLMGSGDWNDGMNRVGHEGRGESVWLGWFLCHIVNAWLPLALARGDAQRAARWDSARAGWRHALEGPAWDGAWFRRAFFDDGSALGSHTASEARIDLIAQAWAVLSGEATHERQRLAMLAVDHALVDADHGLVRLLDPPLVHASPSAGYIQAYPPGVRENGGQYTHAGAWALMAAAVVALREPGNDSAHNTPYRLFTCLSPAHRAAHPQWGRPYGLEPYAVAADVYSAPPYVGRGGWSWYTGAAGWLHRGAVESILGLHLQADELWFTPCLPLHWPRAELTLQRDGRRMRFVLLRADESTAQAVCAGLDARLLRAGEYLRWTGLPVDSTCVIPLG